MQRVGLASFVSGAGLYLVLASPFHVGGPLHLRGFIFGTRLARQHREHTMAGTIAPIYHCEESLPIREICATYRACPARARWGQNDGSVAHPAEYFLGGAPAIGTCPEGIGKFVAARQLSGHPIVVSPWDKIRVGRRFLTLASIPHGTPPTVYRARPGGNGLQFD